MGHSPTEKPTKLGKKLVQIRRLLGLSQNEMVRRLGLDKSVSREEISKYERGVRVPPLLTILKYARVANVPMEVLVDDALLLPGSSPTKKGKTRLRAS